MLDRYKTHDISLVVDNLSVKDDFESKRILSESIKIAMKYGNDTIFILDSDSGKPEYFSRNLMCPETGISYPKPEPNTFSFNSPKGMCESCNGLGTEYEINIKKGRFGANMELDFINDGPVTILLGNEL